MEDSAANTIVLGTITGTLTGGNTADVQSALYGHGSFHLDGATQYVTIPLKSDLMRADEITNLWTKHASNPVLSDISAVQFGQLAQKPGGGWYFFGAFDGDIYRWTSTDLVTWTDKTQVLVKAVAGSWDSTLEVCLAFELPDTSWVMFYRADGTGGKQIGKATSADGTTWARVGDGRFPQFGSNYDPTGIILIDGTYYIYVNGSPDHDHTNIYTSTDLVTWSAYANNPIFNNAFCGYVFKRGSYYYYIVPRDLDQTSSTVYAHGIALYRCTDQYFDYGNREYLGYIVINDKSYDDRYLDTPTLPFTDVNRDTYGAEFGGTLYCLYTGDLTGATQNLVSVPFTTLDALAAIPENDTEIYHRQERSWSFNVQFDTVTANDVLFSVGAAVGDSSPVQHCKLNGTALSLYLDGAYRTTTQTIAANTPYHIVVVDGIGETKVYVNTILVGTFAFENPATDAINLYIGNGEGNQPVDGYIWDFRTYAFALNATQVEHIYITGLA